MQLLRNNERVEESCNSVQSQAVEHKNDITRPLSQHEREAFDMMISKEFPENVVREAYFMCIYIKLSVTNILLEHTKGSTVGK